MSMTKKVSKGFWSIVKEIIRKNYDVLKTERLRDGYYIIRDEMTKLIGKTISQEDYNYFLGKGGYDYFVHGIWTALEQQEGYERPEAKPVGNVWDQGYKETIDHLKSVWSQARGFIFTEKNGEKLARLSEFGWAIVEPDQGYPTRFIRQILKQDTRPVLAVHDADVAGEGIYRALGFETRRTKHLDISLDNITDLGLNWKDVKTLRLPTQLEAEKFRAIKKDRCEIQSMAVLKKRFGIDNPFLNYVVIRMLQEGIMISPTPVETKILLRSGLKGRIHRVLERVVDPVVDEFVDGLDSDGEAVDLNLPDVERLNLADLEALVKQLASKLEKGAERLHEKDFHNMITDDVSKKMRKLMDGGKDG